MTDDDKQDILSSDEKGAATSTLGGAVAGAVVGTAVGTPGGGYGDRCRVWRLNGRSQEKR